ncbi:uncharacterized protein K452DRAFT_350914 [Aplosporella prunicola CBS 121167]|uniref:Catalase core domain-containing protein n=1 Tax=Aplosporella prunicola CBS 121167 TaxID=1176127 RepID=A0A6A6BEN6_9PEZI|nr:uncharacterized protein K452DRAFT_350914 [Aplosporella prunicola CBS 121167]KAF2142610.1 hypothetical protein K452DRAFT_350914 [Aplosporella prunicola CBS 121167]
MSDLASRTYIRWDAEGVEVVPPNEAQDIQATADMINESQRSQWDHTRHCFGGTHARTQGIVKGKLIVPDDLPKHLKQTELFEKGGEYPVACRYSSEPGDPGLDAIFNVEGEMFEAGAGIPTQDIEFNSTAAIELADAKTTREILELRTKYGGNKAALDKHLEQRPDAALQKARDQVPNTHLVATRLYSQTAFRFGDYVVKYCLISSSETQRKLADETVKPDHGSDVLHRWLQNYYCEHDAEYLFQVQLLENLEDQPVEYAGTAWDEEKYPWQTVARLVIPMQNSFDYERKTFWEDHLRMDPWHGLVSLRPLGSSNRVRRGVYPASSVLRRHMNGRKEVNVKSIDEIPN